MVYTVVFDYFDGDRERLCVHGEGSVPDVRAALLASPEWDTDHADISSVRVEFSFTGCRNKRHKGFLHPLGCYSYHNYT